MSTYRFVVPLAWLGLLSACGGGGPTAPSSTAGPTPSPSPTATRFCLVDDLIAPLAGATVGLTGPTASEERSTDTSGCVDVPNGWTVSYAQAPAFRRLTDFPARRDDVALPAGTHALWPVRGYLERLEMQDAGYSNAFPDFCGCRPKTGTYTVSVPAEIAGLGPAEKAQYQAALDALLADAGAQASSKVAFVVGSGATAIRMVVDPSISRGYFEPTANGREIIGGLLRFRSLDMILTDPGTIRHEFGHFLGVNHVIDNPNRLMYRSSPEFGYATEEEVIHFRMRFLRPVAFDPRKG